MGGDVRAQNHVDGGAVFSVTLRLARCEASESAQDAVGEGGCKDLRVRRPSVEIAGLLPLESDCLRRVLRGAGFPVTAVHEPSRRAGDAAAGVGCPARRSFTDAHSYVAVGVNATGDHVWISPADRLSMPREIVADAEHVLIERPIHPDVLVAAVCELSQRQGSLGATDITAELGVTAEPDAPLDAPTRDVAHDGGKPPGIAPAQIASGATKVTALQAAQGRFQLRVLVAEDNAVNTLVVRSLLERAGCRVVCVEDGRAAIAAATASLAEASVDARFDLVLMDLRMPDVDGWRALTEINRCFAGSTSAAHRPIIVALTAHAFAEDRERCLAHGFDGYLAKPFDPVALDAVLNRAAARRAAAA